MKEKSSANMRQQRLRQRRIKRIKTTVMATIGMWMMVSMVVCVALVVQLFRLNNRIDELEANMISVHQLPGGIQSYQGAAGDSGRRPQSMVGSSNEEEPQDNGTRPETDAAVGADETESDGMLEDNLPKEGVRQKVYLTFDDGPSENTARILDILEEKGVKATFFVTGSEDELAKEMYQQIVERGHTMGIHSYSHQYSVIYDSLEAYADDFNQLRTYLTEVTGVEPSIARFPGGSSNQVSNLDMREFIRFLNQEGVNYYDWNVASGDATSQAYTPDELVENVIQDVKKYDTSIVLMHDSSTKGATVEALGPMIDQLLAMDMELLPIDGNTKLIQHISADSVDNVSE